jgi:hypothetical protein
MTQTDNEIRSKRCAEALARYGNGSPEENLTDFLTDAMHWCDDSPIDFHHFLAQACRHYVNEFNGDQQDERRMCPSSDKLPSNPIDIDAILAQRRQVAVIWAIEDVQHIRPDLNQDQAWDVLERCRDKHDCEYGFTWDYVRDVADDLFPMPRKSRNRHGGQHD